MTSTPCELPIQSPWNAQGNKPPWMIAAATNSGYRSTRNSAIIISSHRTWCSYTWHIWRNKVRILQMSGQQEVVTNDQIDLIMNHTEESRELETFTQRRHQFGKTQALSLPRQFTLLLQGPPKPWKAVLHQRSATCKRTPLWARKHLDFISSPSPNAAMWLPPPSQVLWMVTSWDSTLFALSGSLMPFLILRVPKYPFSLPSSSQRLQLLVCAQARAHTDAHRRTHTTWHRDAENPIGTHPQTICINILAPKTRLQRSPTSKREHPVV